MNIRPATLEDASAILEIYNDAILHTTAVYSYHPVTLENRIEWRSDMHSNLAAGKSHGLV
jgi:L-amino acid N-acyltransferase